VPDRLDLEKPMTWTSASPPLLESMRTTYITSNFDSRRYADDAPMFMDASYEQDDKEADLIYAAVDKKVR
jgi:hypothetical protein